VSRRTFRARLFIALLIASVLPLAMVAAAGAWVVANRPAIDASAVIAPVGRTELTLSRELAKIHDMSPELRAAIQSHDDSVRNLMFSATNTRRDQTRWVVAAPTALLIAAGGLVVIVAIVSLRLSRQYSAPLNEIVDWTRRIQRHEVLPSQTADENTVPELVTLQSSLYELQQGLEQARAAELEAERLRAFGEVARRVAHEMKNPLTPIRLAVRQLARRAPPDMQVELEVIATESARLEVMAKDFAELGRLPAGIAASVDLCELLEDLMRNALPDGMTREFRSAEPGITIEGYYDPLRRAFSNVLRNAVEACKGEGAIRIAVQRGNGNIAVTVSDDGPGIPADRRELIFQPYYTDKGDGTGLGLAIVRQTIEQHHGTIGVRETPGGGATFVVQFPA
jgi:two-component system nitrogen regulation sensor histidine kinase NtrY